MATDNHGEENAVGVPDEGSRLINDLSDFLASEHAKHITPGGRRLLQYRLVLEQKQRQRQQERFAIAAVFDVFAVEWTAFVAEDYASIIREPDHEFRVVQVQQIYAATRMEAVKEETTAAFLSPNETSFNQKFSPVPLCGKEGAEEDANSAHLCPRSGKEMTTDTWLYVAAAALGLESDTKEQRNILYKALRGSKLPLPTGPAGKDKPIIDNTGINRAPFNLMPFLDQKVWFDKYPGVVVLPILSVENMRNWTGEAYSVLILCNDVPAANTSAIEVSQLIGLIMSDFHEQNRATMEDVHNAQAVLAQVVKASAFCLNSKEGPDHSKAHQLWQKYRAMFLSFQGGLSANTMTLSTQKYPEFQVPVPLARTEQTDKFIMKMDLGSMRPGDGETTSYPDPLLLAFKSSINWTRFWHFQMLAEGEPEDFVLEQD